MEIINQNEKESETINEELLKDDLDLEADIDELPL